MGDDHPWTATGIKNLGELLLKMGDSAGAQAQFSEALRIRKLVYGDTHPLVAEARTLLGSARALQQVSDARRSEEHTSELQSLMRISYAVFCLKKKTNKETLIH